MLPATKRSPNTGRPLPDVIEGVRLAPSPDRLAIDPRALDAFCERHAIKALYLFGSALTDAFDARSDVDLMFETDGASPDYFEQMNMTDELRAIFGRAVDLISRCAVEQSANQTRRRSILESARVIFSR